MTELDLLRHIVFEQSKVIDTVRVLYGSRLGDDWYMNIAAVLTAYEHFTKEVDPEQTGKES